MYISKNKIKDEKVTYHQIRNNAREQLQGICAVNRVCDGNSDRFCMGQSYGSNIGLGGVGKGLSFTENIKSLDKIKLKEPEENKDDSKKAIQRRRARITPLMPV